MKAERYRNKFGEKVPCGRCGKRKIYGPNWREIQYERGNTILACPKCEKEIPPNYLHLGV